MFDIPNNISDLIDSPFWYPIALIFVCGVGFVVGLGIGLLL